MKLVQRLPVNLDVSVLNMGFPGREKKEVEVNGFVKEIIVIHGDRPMINVVTDPHRETSPPRARLTLFLPTYIQADS